MIDGICYHSEGNEDRPVTRIAVLDDWQKIARRSTDWSALTARADVHFFETPFADENDAARRLADFDIVLATRERTPFPASRLLHRRRTVGNFDGGARTWPDARCGATDSRRRCGRA